MWKCYQFTSIRRMWNVTKGYDIATKVTPVVVRSNQQNILLFMYFIWIWSSNFTWTEETHSKVFDKSCKFHTKFMRISYDVHREFILIESFWYICISCKLHMKFICTSREVHLNFYIVHVKCVWSSCDMLIWTVIWMIPTVRCTTCISQSVSGVYITFDPSFAGKSEV